jgi:integrase
VESELGIRVHLRDVGTIFDLADVTAPGPTGGRSRLCSLTPSSRCFHHATTATSPPHCSRVKSSALRTAIQRACRATGTPLWSPHDLKHRRISLLHAQGKTWAEISELVGNASAKVLSDTYTHVLMDERELDYVGVIAERLGASTILRRPETMEV